MNKILIETLGWDSEFFLVLADSMLPVSKKFVMVFHLLDVRN